MSFSDQQKSVIKSNAKRLAVFAGAGAGKTTTMVEKVNQLIKEGVAPRNMALITFTNEAADNLTEKLEKLGIDVDGLTVKTLHSFCYGLLKVVYNFSGRSTMPKIIQKPDMFLGHYWKLVAVYDKKDETVQYSSSRMPHKSWKEYYKYIYAWQMDRQLPEDVIKKLFDGLTPDQFRKRFLEKDFAGHRLAWSALWFLEYESWKKSTKQIDFNDMLTVTLRELAVANDKTLGFIKNKYKTIIVDESQDTNALVVDVLKYITDENTNIILVGDLRQSIFAFIGASPKTILDYIAYDKFEKLTLNTNYRSHEEIISNANYFVAHYPSFNIGGDMLAHKAGNGFPVCSVVATDEIEEIQNVAGLIQKSLDAGYKYKDICVMFRTNAQAMMILHWCVSTNTPFNIKKDCASIFDRSEMRDILAYMKILNEPNKTKREDFKRIVNKPLRYVSNKALEDVNNMSADEIGYGVDFFNKNHRDQKLSDFSLAMKQHVKHCKGLTMDSQVDYIMSAMGYEKWWESSEEDARFFDLSIYANALKRIASESKDYRDLIRKINELRKAIKEKNSDDGINFTSIHSSKGLEWPVCIVLGVCDRVYPFYRAVQESGKEGFEEEARLFYVASTRPIERLYYSEIHGHFGKFQVQPSPFVYQSQRQIIDGEYYGKESIPKDFFRNLAESI